MKTYLPGKKIKKWKAFHEYSVHSRMERWPLLQKICMLLHIIFLYLAAYFERKIFFRKWLKKSPLGERYFDFNGIKLTEYALDTVTLNGGARKWYAIHEVFIDSFLVYLFYGDNYDRTIVEAIEPYMPEGPYGYKDGAFEVTIKAGDTVIDAGAWIGDFSAYCAAKGAVAYAFEPFVETFQLLSRTAQLNKGSIIPVNKGLGSSSYETPLYVDDNSASSTIFSERKKDAESDFVVSITSLDDFVREQHLARVDFIKADIEGSEREMLKGASMVLKEFAPKLALCTYHLKDDPVVLEKLILEANPKYRVVHLRKKLYAAVIPQQ